MGFNKKSVLLFSGMIWMVLRSLKRLHSSLCTFSKAYSTLYIPTTTALRSPWNTVSCLASC
ncbi:hypothetical protein CALCODRAFT_489195 [Calocera cornea HHB12733]|uniref:Uncharacterized protein n=1 Tax=Calocera cornea HHB12733 TaxID=1353952 RepID=A0A166JFB2_9BASI|nr:hypothetical protein CALCODRAFT_489195 [Calocera cornea HHB12733]